MMHGTHFRAESDQGRENFEEEIHTKIQLELK